MAVAQPRSVKGAARRAQILSTAFDVLSQDGYRRTSLREIARALDLEPAHILYYFASREDLLVEVVQTWQQRTLEAASAAHPDGDELEVWMAVVRENVKRYGLVYLYTTFSAEAADPEHPAHEYFLDRLALLVESFGATIEERQRAGRIAAHVEPRAAARRLIALSDGLQLQWLADPRIDMAAVLEAEIEQLARG